MKRDPIAVGLDALEKVLTVVGWALVFVSIFFFSLPER